MDSSFLPSRLVDVGREGPRTPSLLSLARVQRRAQTVHLHQPREVQLINLLLATVV